MLRTYKIVVFGLLFLCLPYQQVDASKDPLSILKETQKKIITVLEKKIDSSDKALKRQQEKDLKKLVRPFIDFRYLGREALSNHWKQLTPKQHAQFLYWLEALLELAYIRNLHSGVRNGKKKNFKIEYLKQEVKEKKATVFTLIRIQNKRTKRWGKIRINWKFYFSKKKNTWMVMDVETNDNGLIETYQEQFDKIIQRKSFEDLMKRIKKNVQRFRKQEGLSPLKEGVYEAEGSSKVTPKITSKCPKNTKEVCSRICLKRSKKRCLRFGKNKRCGCVRR